MSALIIVDISMILIRSTLMMFFCNFVMMWLILLLRLLCFHKKRKKMKVNIFPSIQYIHNLYNYLFLCGFSVCTV